MKNLTDYLITIFLFGLFIYVLFIYRYSFNFSVHIFKQYKLLFLSGLFIALIALTKLLKPNPSWKECTISLLIGIFLFLSYLNCYNEYFTITLIFIMTSLILFLVDDILLIVKLLYFINYIFFIYELNIVFGQIRNSLPLTGTLLNSGVFAIYTICQIPICLTISNWKKKYSKTKNRLISSIISSFNFIIVLFIIFIIFESNSRTAQLALYIFTIIFIYNKIEFKKYKIKVYSFIGVLSVSTISIVYYFLSFKQMSINGRILMNKVALLHIKDFFWFGLGIGKFTFYYPQWQAQYLQNVPTSTHNFSIISSGESYIILNEYLQLIETIGVVGFIFLLFILIRFYHTITDKYKDIFLVIKLTVLIILSCGFTSYPLHVNILLLYLALCFGSVFALGENRRALYMNNFFTKLYSKYKIWIIVPSVVLIIFSSTLITYKYYFVHQWEILSNANNKSFSYRQKEFKNLYNSLKSDGKFLTLYGQVLLYDSTKNNQTVEILNLAKDEFISRETIETLAQAYLQIKDYKNAAKCLKWICNYLPNLFTPKLKLLNIYKKSGDKIGSREISENIINTPVKIPSPLVNFIKDQAYSTLAD